MAFSHALLTFCRHVRFNSRELILITIYHSICVVTGNKVVGCVFSIFNVLRRKFCCFCAEQRIALWAVDYWICVAVGARWKSLAAPNSDHFKPSRRLTIPFCVGDPTVYDRYLSIRGKQRLPRNSLRTTSVQRFCQLLFCGGYRKSQYWSPWFLRR